MCDFFKSTALLSFLLHFLELARKLRKGVWHSEILSFHQRKMHPLQSVCASPGYFRKGDFVHEKIKNKNNFAEWYKWAQHK